MSIASLLKSNAPPAPSLQFTLMSFAGTVIAIALTGWFSLAFGTPWLMASSVPAACLPSGCPTHRWPSRVTSSAAIWCPR